MKFDKPVKLTVGDADIRNRVTQNTPMPDHSLLTFRFAHGVLFAVKRVGGYYYMSDSGGTRDWYQVWNTIHDTECMTLFEEKP